MGRLRFGRIECLREDAVVWVTTLEHVRGYRQDLICDEEPELCLRLRPGSPPSWSCATLVQKC